VSEEKKDEFAGLRKTLERYTYIDDMINELKGLDIQIDRYKSKMEFFFRRRDISLRIKNQLLKILEKDYKEVKDLINEIKKNIKGMTSTEKRLKLQKLTESIRKMLKRIDEYVG